jgi:TatD DNase family protein
MLFDSHCHLQHKRFHRDREEVIRRASEAGVTEILVCGYDIPSSRQAILVSRDRDGFYSSCGIHPHDAAKLTPATANTLKRLAKETVAIGEIGLDFYRDLSPRGLQVEAFKKQVVLARHLGLPIIIHVRKAYSKALSVLQELGNQYKGVMHCFSGDVGDAAEAVRLGFHISFSGSITYGSLELERVVRFVPSDRLLIETDAPYLTPTPHRGERNEPAHLRLVCKKVASTRNISYEDVARITRVNGRTLFLGELPPPSLVYQLGSSLYLNVTNRCTNECSFCVRARSPFLRGYNLKLEEEPKEEELLKAIGDPARFKEIVFCGYGEPLIRLDLVKKLAARLKKKGATVRVNTNGEANLIHGRDVIPEIAPVVDALSISLNADSKGKYSELCKPKFGPETYDSVLDFARKARGQISRVILSVVALPDVSIERCRELAERLGCEFKIRRRFEGAGFR